MSPTDLLPYIVNGGTTAVIVLLCVAVWYFWQRATKFETERDTERESRHTEGRAAADVINQERLTNVGSIAAIDRRDDRIAALERELGKCERSLERYRFPSSSSPPEGAP